MIRADQNAAVLLGLIATVLREGREENKVDWVQGRMQAGISEIEREPVESEAMLSIAYDAQTRTLEIEFTNGSVYRYFGVAKEFYLRFMQSDSKGRFFHAFILRKIPFVRVR